MPAPPGVSIRPLRKTDSEDLQEAIGLRYEERADGAPIWTTMFLHRPPPEFEEKAFDGLFRGSSEGSAVVRVAERNGRAVGFCNIAPIIPGEPSEQSHVGELGILVHRDHRGLRIGTALLEACLEAARPRFEMVYLSVWSKNDSAMRLYRRFGFSPCGHFPRMIKRGGRYFDEERMVLDLSHSPGGSQENR